MVRKSTRIRYDSVPVPESDRENLYDSLQQYHPDILERTPASTALDSGPRSQMPKAGTRKYRSSRERLLNAENGEGDSTEIPTYSAIVRLSDGKGGFERKRVQIELPYMVIFMQSYLNEYIDLLHCLILRQNDRTIVEELLQELLRNYHGLLMSEYRNMFYTMLNCAPRVVFSMLRFEFWRDLILRPHDLVSELDLHRQLRQSNDEYNQMVMEYTEYANRVKRYVARTKFHTIQEAERLQRLARYQRLIRQNKPIPKDLLEALAQDEQAQLSEEKRQQDNIDRRHYAALKNEYARAPLPPEDEGTSESFAGKSVTSSYEGFLDEIEQKPEALDATEDKPSSKKAISKKKAKAKTADAADADEAAELESAAAESEAAAEAADAGEDASEVNADDYREAIAEAEYDYDDDFEDYDDDVEFYGGDDDFEDEDELDSKGKAKGKRLGAKARQHKGETIGNTTVKSKGTRNLNTNYLLLQKLSTTKTAGPLDGRSKRDNLPKKLGRGKYRRIPLPQTYEIRRDIDNISDFLEHDRELMLSALMSLVTNQARLRAIYGESLKRFNLDNPRFVDVWLNLETMDQPCMVLFVGSLVEVRPHNTKRSVYTAAQANRNFITLDGLDFRVGAMPPVKKTRRRQSPPSLGLPLLDPMDDDDDQASSNRINIIKEDQLSPYELIYIKL